MTELLGKLAEHAKKIDPQVKAPIHFRTMVLLDDFSASGSSYLSPKDDGSYGGKVAKFLSAVTSKSDSLNQLCHPGGVELVILIYMATEKAIAHLRTTLTDYALDGVTEVRIETVQPVPQNIALLRRGSGEFGKLIQKYYDDGVFDMHLRKGGTEDARYGYADCGLPLVLHHNTPNNSLALLWSYEGHDVRGLFPRVQRHREMA